MASDRSYGVAAPGYRLPELTHLGRVQLQVSGLERSLSYYRDVLGLVPLSADATRIILGSPEASAPLIELRERRGARPVPQGGLLGLFHFAMLLPSRAALGQFTRHLVNERVRFASADHFVSEAIYLWDPDGLGVEIYADRPRSAWRSNDRELIMTTEPLDLRSLLTAAGDDEWTGMPAGTTMGHMHLSVDNVARAREFYHRALGLDVVVWNYPGALFMSAGGYHHHLGTNSWAAGARAPTDGDARLLEWELILPDASDVQAAVASLRSAGYPTTATDAGAVVSDPWGTPLRLRTAA